MAPYKRTLLCSLFALIIFSIGDVDAQGCGNTVYTEPTGTITSPNYPEDYNNYDNCTYTIHASETSSFYMTFQVFHLELSSDCMYDWVQIQCSDGSTVTPKYCSQTDPPPIVITNCNEVWMRFQSDEAANYQGFSLQYSVTPNAFTTQPTTKSSIVDCGNTVFTEPTGTITSPSYPGNYDNNASCTYAIQASQTSSFYMTFQEFHLALSSDCMYDWVQFECKDGSTVTPRYCGTTDPPPIVIDNCNEVWMKFQSDEAVAYEGFSLQYTVTPNAYTTHPTTKSSIVDCGNTVFTEPSGTITSPSYPGNYDNNASCTYAIQASQTSSFYMTFQEFHLALSSDCMYDWVQFECKDGSTVTPKYCGQTDPPPIVIDNCIEVWMKFQSDEAQAYEGFSLQYTVTPNAYTTHPTTKSSIVDCGNTVYTEPTGTITSPNYPGNYNNNASCTYAIQAPQTSSFIMIFQVFQLEFSSDCQYDWVQIQCSDGSTVTQKFCGSSIPPPFVIDTCKEVLVRFQSDDSQAYKGFSLQYSVTPTASRRKPSKDISTAEPSTTMSTISSIATSAYTTQPTTKISTTEHTMKTPTINCGNTLYTEPSGTITSPNYPENYNYDDNCTYAIQASQSSSFALTFQAFHLEFSDCKWDWVQIGCKDGSGVTPKYCGTTLPPPVVIDNCSEVLVLFHSDDSQSYGGFSLLYSVTPYGSTIKPSTSLPTTTMSTTSTIAASASTAMPTTTIATTDSTIKTSTTTTAGTSTISTTATSGCGNSLWSGSSGTITSPNYPADYNNNLDCTYAIRAAQSSSFTMTFQAFHLESSDVCLYDWVQIRCKDGSTVTPKHCGSTIPPPIVINNCNEVLVWFRSDNSQTYDGFSLLYSVTPYGCGNTVYTEPSGIITSPNYPGDYNNNVNCTYAIRASQTSSFTMAFQAFQLEELDDNCHFDWVQIGCKDGSTVTPKHCGSTIPPPVVINSCNEAFVWFRSDGSGTYNGFSLQYSVTPYVTTDTCEPPDDVPLIVVSTLLVISSLGYIVLLALFVIQRNRQRTSKTGAKTAEGEGTDKDYATIYPASGNMFDNISV